MNQAVRTSADTFDIVQRAIDALNGSGGDLPLGAVDAALERSRNDYRLWHVKGLMHRKQEYRELAVPALRRAAELAPADPLVWHGYARTSFEAGLASVELYARALKLAPGNPDVVKGLASALAAEGHLDDAIAGLETVLARSPLWTDGHRLLAELRWVHGERKGFTRSFDEALKEHPTSHELRREQMTALLLAEHFDEVLEQIADGQQRFGRHPLFVAFEAAVQSEIGEVDTADRLFIELAPFADASSDNRHVRHLLRSGRCEQSIPIIDKWLAAPERGLFWPSAAAAWRLTNDPRAEWLAGDEAIVGVYDIEDELPAADELASLLRGLHRVRGQPLAQSVRGGTQTDGNLFHRIEPAIVALRESIRQIVKRHVANLPRLNEGHPLEQGRPAGIEFSGAWSVRLNDGGYHTNHVHPQGWLSSALYLVLPPALGGDERLGWLTLGEPDAKLDLGLEPLRLVEPRVARLVLFPSWMWHGTRPFNQGERLTVAFDVAAKHELA